MIIPTGRKYTATVGGAVWKEVLCQHCGTEFVYLLERQASGEGSSPFWLDNKGAEHRAEERATRKLAERLAADSDPVACPECGRYQAEMVALLKREKWRWALYLGVFIVFFYVVGNWLFVVVSERVDQFVERLFARPFVLIPTFALVTSLGALLRRHLYDPNADAASRAGTTLPGPEGPFRRDEFQQLVADARKAQVDNVPFDFDDAARSRAGVLDIDTLATPSFSRQHKWKE